MDIRPQDLPELRAELLAWAPRLTENIAARMRALYKSAPPAKALRDVLRDRVARADLFWASKSMTDLAVAASATLTTFAVEPQDLPAEAGLLVFEKPLRLEDPAGEIPVTIRGLSWSTIDSRISVTAYWDRDERAADGGNYSPAMPPLLPAPGVMFAVNFGDAGWCDLGVRTGQRMVFPILVSTWLLMQQPLADVQEAEADRAARKRLRRLGQEPAAVRVIELRRPKHTGGEPGESGRNYTHRWITRGHWRQQWYPGRQVHRPVWIAPHVKGPEGAPMIGGEKVYAWKR